MTIFIRKAFLFFSQAMGVHWAQTFLSFNCWVKTLWADPNNIPHYEQYFHCLSGVSFNQACHTSNISIGYNNCGLTRMGTIFEASKTILKFHLPPYNYM